MTYSLVKADGAISPIYSEKPLPLEKLQALVGGYIEMLDLPDGTTLCINEEGRLNGLPVNVRYPQVVGDAVIGRVTKRGDFVGLL